MAIHDRDTLSPRESFMLEHEKEQGRIAREHAIRMKQLDIEVQKMEAKWSAWLRIPMFIIMLPVRLLFAIAFIVAVSRKVTLGEDFWNFMRK